MTVPACPSTSRRTVLTGLVAGLTGCSALRPAEDDPPGPADWPVQGGSPAGTYHKPDADVPTDSVRTAWKRQVEAPFGLFEYAEPTLYDGTLYCNRDRLRCYSADDGSLRQEVGSPMTAPPTVVTGSVYRNASLVGPRTTGETMLGSRQALQAVNPAPGVTSRLRWRYPQQPGTLSPWGDTPNAPVPVGDHLLVGGRWTDADDEHHAGLLALSASDGEVVWRYTHGGDDDLAAPFGRPAVRDGVAYACSVRGRCHAIDVRDGSRQWTQDAPQGGGLSIRPMAATDRAVVVGDEGVLWGLNPGTGRVEWERREPGWLDTDTYLLTASEDTVVVHWEREETRRLLALDAATGDLRWDADVEYPEGQPVVADGTVFSPEGDDLLARDLRDGTERWRHTPEFSPGTPVVGDGRLYVHCYEGLYALEAPA